MKFAKYDRHGIFLLSAVAILFVVVSIGCSKSNESKIVGNWKGQSIDSINGSTQYTFINFYKVGVVSKITDIKISENLSKIKKIMGKYKFEDGKNNISITWDDGKSEKINVNFPQDNKMLLGKHEMERIK